MGEKFDELIGTFINGNFDEVKRAWKKFNYIDKDNFIDAIRSSEEINEADKIKMLAIILRSTF